MLAAYRAGAFPMPVGRGVLGWFSPDPRAVLPVDGVHAGLLDLDEVSLPKTAIYYLCGPLPFMKAIRSALLGRGVAAQDIQYEVFGPDLWQADGATEQAST